MEIRRCAFGFLLALGLVTACRQATPTPGMAPTKASAPTVETPTQTPPSPEAIGTPTAITVPTAETAAPAEVVAARDAVLAFIGEQHSQDAPDSTLAWVEERTTPHGLIGAETYRYTAGDWVISISYPVVAPGEAAYQTVVANSATAFSWQGEVNAAGDVIEFSAGAQDPVLTARDEALAYLDEHYAERAPEVGLTWTRRRMTPEGIVGAETYQYRSGFWVVTVSHPVVAPSEATYRVLVSNDSTGFQWQGEVDATGKVEETVAPIVGLPIIGWYGSVISLPDDAPFDDYLTLHPDGTGEVGVTGADPAIEAAIDRLRDSETFAHFWGTLVCGVQDHNECQLTVTRLRPDSEGALFDPDPIAPWEGTIVGLPDGATFDDYFVLAGDFPIPYGIDSTDPALTAQLSDLRDTETPIRVWGRLTCGVPDVNSSQIGVIAIEVLGALPAAEPVVIDGWTGTIVRLAPDAEYDDYFGRNDGQLYGIDSTDEDMQQRIQALRTVGARIRIWGQLITDVPDVEGRQIQLERYELEKRSEPVEGWAGILVALEPGAQYDDYFERDNGQRYGIETPDPKLAKRLETLRAEGARVKVWGELWEEVLDVEGRQIHVLEIEVID